MRGRREIMWWREHGKGERKREGGGRLAKRRKKISHSKRVSALRWRERKGGGGEVSFSLSLSLSSRGTGYLFESSCPFTF